MTVYDFRRTTKRKSLHWGTIILIIVNLILIAYIVVSKSTVDSDDGKLLPTNLLNSFSLSQDDPEWVAEQAIKAFNERDWDTLVEYCSQYCIAQMSLLPDHYESMSYVKEQPEIKYRVIDYERVSPDSARAYVVCEADFRDKSKADKFNNDWRAIVFQMDMELAVKKWQCYNFVASLNNERR